MQSNTSSQSAKAAKWYGLVRSPENGGRRSRTLRNDGETAQVQAKVAAIAGVGGTDLGRMLQLRFWTEEGGWNHIVIDPDRPGLAGIVAVGYGGKETESWEMARQSALDGYNVEL
jgi:hypothetical protein